VPFAPAAGRTGPNATHPSVSVGSAHLRAPPPQPADVKFAAPFPMPGVGAVGGARMPSHSDAERSRFLWQPADANARDAAAPFTDWSAPAVPIATDYQTVFNLWQSTPPAAHSKDASEPMVRFGAQQPRFAPADFQPAAALAPTLPHANGPRPAQPPQQPIAPSQPRQGLWRPPQDDGQSFGNAQGRVNQPSISQYPQPSLNAFSAPLSGQSFGTKMGGAYTPLQAPAYNMDPMADSVPQARQGSFVEPSYTYNGVQDSAWSFQLPDDGLW
jgi:hypothetical protein